MTNQDADHALGLELQIEELVEQAARADIQGRQADAAALHTEITALQAELVATAERAAAPHPEPPAVVHADHPQPGPPRSP